MKDLTICTGEELAEILSGEIQRVMGAYATVTNSMTGLHLVQNELERRKLEKAGVPSEPSN